MDDKEELAVLHFLENVVAGITRINSDLLESVKNVDSMTRPECCTSLVELKKTLNDLTHWKQNFGTAVFKIEEYLRPLLRDLQMVLMINLKQALENASNLDDLLNARIKKLSSVLRGKFGKNVEALKSRFKFVAKEYDVKDPGQTRMDLQFLEGDPAVRKDIICRLFDYDNETVPPPFDHSIMKQEQVSLSFDVSINKLLVEVGKNHVPNLRAS